MKTYLYLSDIHSNFEALKHLDSLPEMQDPDCEIRFGGDYIDGVDLEPDAVINTLRYVKSLCDSGKAKAILGNHDRFILDAAYRPFNETAWWLNGRDETLANLGITYRSPSDLREQLLYHYSDELEWLRDLPYYLEDGKNILVHAGFDLDLSLGEQDPETMLWVRDPYIEGAFSLLRHVELHPKDKLNELQSKVGTLKRLTSKEYKPRETTYDNSIKIAKFDTSNYVKKLNTLTITSSNHSINIMTSSNYSKTTVTCLSTKQRMTINSQQKFGIKTTRKELNMTQVTLEHRKPVIYGPISIQFTKFDTDDERFKNEADELGLKWRREYDENLQKFHKEIETELQQMEQIQEELDMLQRYSSQPQRFSKEYQAKHEKLQRTYQEHNERYCESLRKLTAEETEHPIGMTVYQNYQTLLKERGYVLVNKTTDDRYTTTEIWNKD